MSKYIGVYEPIGDGTRDRGEKKYCLICSSNGIQKAKGVGSFVKVEDFPMDEITRVDCFRGDELENNMAAGTMAGLLLGGFAGAVVGGMLFSGSSKEWWVEIELNKETVRFFRLINQNDSKTFFKWADKNSVPVGAPESQEEADEEPTTNTTSAADEILKFKRLLDQGIITQEEFEKKKKQLLEL